MDGLDPAKTPRPTGKTPRKRGRVLTALGFGFFIDSAEDQALFRDIMGRAYNRVDAASRTDNVSAGEALLENGLKFVQPVDNERDRWDELGRDLRRQLVADEVISAAIVAELDGHLDAFRNGGVATAEQATARQPE